MKQHVTNGTDGGEGFKGQHSMETREKIRQAKLGQKHSEATKLLMSRSNHTHHNYKTWKILDGKRVWINKEVV